MKIAFFTHSAQGHLNPLTTLARRLRSRDHDVTFISFPDSEPLIRACGLPFVPACAEAFPRGSAAEMIKHVRYQFGAEAHETIKLVGPKLLAPIYDSLPGVLREHKVERLVIDEGLLYTGLIPMSVGIPYVSASTGLFYDFTGHSAPSIYDWMPSGGPEARERNRAGARSAWAIYESWEEVGRQYATRVGLEIDWTDPFATISKRAWITQLPEAFDFRDVAYPPQFAYTGLFADGTGHGDKPFPWDKLTGDPLIYASMGTLTNGNVGTFAAIAEAVGERPGFQLVLSIGETVEAEQIGFLPQNAIVAKGVPQPELLKRAALCITHAGLNTALESLSQGVPMVAIPMANDQPGVAARLLHTKTGLYLNPEDLSAARLRKLIDTVLGDPAYRGTAMAMKRRFVETRGLDLAADIVERAFGR